MNEISTPPSQPVSWLALCRLAYTISFVAMVGCGGSGDSGYPPTVPVQGVVNYQGQPVEGALVTFQRTDHSRSAVGRTDAQGHYQLTTFQPGDGAEVGEYDVKIVKYATPAEDPEDGVTPPLKSLIPEKYAAGGLHAAVQSDHDNTFDFNLD